MLGFIGFIGAIFSALCMIVIEVFGIISLCTSIPKK